jgi:hypothetical protein
MIDGGWVPYIFGVITAAIIIRVVKGAFAARVAEEEEELVTYEYMTLSAYWDDLAALLNKAAAEDWEADQVFAPGEEDEEPTYRILLRKEK